MRLVTWLVPGIVGAILAGCATPSVHPIYTAETLITEPGLVGTWRPANEADGKATYTITRVAEGYHLLVKTNDPADPGQWEFAVRLTKIGEHKAADVTAVEEERRAHEDHWGPLFLPTHMFCLYSLEGDTLTVRMLDRDWLKREVEAKRVTLAHTSLSRDTLLLTAETKDLREFVERHAGDRGAFANEASLSRVKP